MAKKYALEWDAEGKRLYEHGVDHGVLYPLTDTGMYAEGVAWNGLSNVDESTEGGEPNTIYADGIKYADIMSDEKFNATIQAYTYPDEFEKCDGYVTENGITYTQQERQHFGLCYRSYIGNDQKKNFGYKIHILYGCLAKPSDRGRETDGESIEAMQFSWEISTTPVEIDGKNPCAHIVVDTTKEANKPEFIDALETLLYGSAEGNAKAKLPTPQEIYALAQQHNAKI